MMPNTKWNFKLLTEHKEKPTGPGVTVPDDTLSLKEIMEKYARDSSYLEMVKKRSGLKELYEPNTDFDSEDLEKLQGMDLAEMSERKERLEKEFEEGVEKRKAELEAKLEEKRKKAIKRKQKSAQQESSRATHASEDGEATEGSARPTKEQGDPKDSG